MPAVETESKQLTQAMSKEDEIAVAREILQSSLENSCVYQVGLVYIFVEKHSQDKWLVGV